MKVFSFIASVFLIVLTGCSTTGRNAQPTDTKGGARELTGSRIEQNVRQNGDMTDSANNVRVYDRKRIERSGQSNVRDFLRQQGATP